MKLVVCIDTDIFLCKCFVCVFPGVFQQREAVAAGDWPLRQWKCQQAASGQQVWSHYQESGGLYHCQGTW